MKFKRLRITVETEEDDSRLMRPDHVCRMPKSRLFGGGPEYTPEDHEDVPLGTRWICDCGRAWIVKGSLFCWVRDPSNDIEGLVNS